jgi:hypothetical protein
MPQAKKQLDGGKIALPSKRSVHALLFSAATQLPPPAGL